jgi:hypothetical protein
VTRLRSRGFRASFRGAGLVPSLLAIAFFAFHIPFLPASLEDLDSINFALGIRRFDVAAHQPHPPGYPVFIALAKAINVLVHPEAHALAFISVIAGSLSVFALVALFERIEAADPTRAGSRDVPLTAAVLAGTTPLFWFTAGRPLSDMAGLAAALGAQVLVLRASTRREWIVAAVLAGVAAGLRSQVLWLTVPLLFFRILRRPGPTGTGLRTAILWFAVGVLAWAIPLVLLSGGPAAYWRALFNQGTEDLGGVDMLWTTRTPRRLLLALNSIFVVPWAAPWLAALVLVAAIAGAVRVYRMNSPAVTTLAIAFGPYALFDLLFQESTTARYALPLIVPVAFFAASGLRIAGVRAGAVLVIALAAFGAHVGGRSLASYASAPAPAFRLLRDMRDQVGEPPVLAMHRREDLDLRRPIVWVGAGMPPIASRLSAPPKHEWQELVKYWNSGGRRPVWLVADPLRADLALIDRRDASIEQYRWPLPYHALIGGVRPDVMDWLRLPEPSWYLGEGWALTPETAGVAAEDGRGPGRGGIQGWIRRWHDASTLAIGGRNLAPSGPEAHVRFQIDGRTIEERPVPPGFFFRLLELPAGALDGEGRYAPLTITADSASVAIEQFDAQPADRVVFGFGEGWQEAEYNPALGLQWRWMSERGVLRVHAAGHSLALTLKGESPLVYFSKPSRIVVRVGERIVGEQSVGDAFAIDVRIPAELIGGSESAITIETDQMYVPAERSRRARDRRHLGLRVFECSVRAAGT